MQFILNIPFTQPVRIKSILINPGRGDFAPRRIRAYVNRIHGVDFEEVEASSAPTAPDQPAAQRAALGAVGSGKPQADFALLDGEPGVSEYPVSAARFASVNSISVVLVSPLFLLPLHQPPCSSHLTSASPVRRKRTRALAGLLPRLPRHSAGTDARARRQAH